MIISHGVKYFIFFILNFNRHSCELGLICWVYKMVPRAPAERIGFRLDFINPDLDCGSAWIGLD